MEELLNKLIEKGWKPRGENAVPNSYWVEGKSICWNRGGKASIRELVSKESGLRQFVCENGMVRKKICYCTIRTDIYELHKYYDYNYEYRLIESALKDESELEQFLLDNIKIGDI